MTLQYETFPIQTAPAGAKHQDLEFEIGALSSRHGLPLDVARMIVNKCGEDLGCIDEEARIWAETR